MGQAVTTYSLYSVQFALLHFCSAAYSLPELLGFILPFYSVDLIVGKTSLPNYNLNLHPTSLALLVMTSQSWPQLSIPAAYTRSPRTEAGEMNGLTISKTYGHSLCPRTQRKVGHPDY